jgi:hypothetical protein
MSVRLYEQICKESKNREWILYRARCLLNFFCGTGSIFGAFVMGLQADPKMNAPAASGGDEDMLLGQVL